VSSPLPLSCSTRAVCSVSPPQGVVPSVRGLGPRGAGVRQIHCAAVVSRARSGFAGESGRRVAFRLAASRVRDPAEDIGRAAERTGRDLESVRCLQFERRRNLARRPSTIEPTDGRDECGGHVAFDECAAVADWTGPRPRKWYRASSPASVDEATRVALASLASPRLFISVIESITHFTRPMASEARVDMRMVDCALCQYSKRHCGTT